MTEIDRQAKHLWSASFFYRRAPHRDRTAAVRILRDLTQSQFGRIAAHARSLLRRIDNEQPPRND